MDLSKELKYDYTCRPPRFDTLQDRAQPVSDVLSPGEKVLWCGQPSQKLLFFRMSDMFMLPFALFWTGFSIVWELGALSAVIGTDGGFQAWGLCFPLFGVPFVLLGLYMLFGRFVMDILARRRTYYALTDRRVFMLTGLRDRNVVSVPLKKINSVDITLHRNGRGTLTFPGSHGEGRTGRKTYYFAGTVATYGGALAFDQIEDPKRVYDMVLEAQEDLWAHQRSNNTPGS